MDKRLSFALKRCGFESSSISFFFVFCVYTEVMAQDDTVTFEKKNTAHFQPLPMSQVDQSLLRIHEVPPLQ